MLNILSIPLKGSRLFCSVHTPGQQGAMCRCTVDVTDFQRGRFCPSRVAVQLLDFGTTFCILESAILFLINICKVLLFFFFFQYLNYI